MCRRGGGGERAERSERSCVHCDDRSEELRPPSVNLAERSGKPSAAERWGGGGISLLDHPSIFHASFFPLSPPAQKPEIKLTHSIFHYSLDQVIEQYSRTVRPMHIEFVEPSKRKADIIVPVGINSVALSLITDHLKVALNDMGGEIKYVKTPYCESNAKERLLGSVVKETKRALLY